VKHYATGSKKTIFCYLQAMMVMMMIMIIIKMRRRIRIRRRRRRNHEPRNCSPRS